MERARDHASVELPDRQRRRRRKHGALPYGRIPLFLDAVRDSGGVLVSTSRAESFGLTVAEAEIKGRDRSSDLALLEVEGLVRRFPLTKGAVFRRTVASAGWSGHGGWATSQR